MLSECFDLQLSVINIVAWNHPVLQTQLDIIIVKAQNLI